MSGVRLGPYLAEHCRTWSWTAADVRGFLHELAMFSAGFIGKATGLPNAVRSDAVA